MPRKHGYGVATGQGSRLLTQKTYIPVQLPKDLRIFLDNEIMEGKIPRKFSQSAKLTAMQRSILRQLDHGN
jgi:hypothetical protein